ncbi:hypothetical protein, partial [Streptomyces hygroscopicus]|uniref:hypothetical protein n=1 Tax=Streptomyces hygroscopicus TaxID=1912 RepID=UPI001BDC3B7B
MDGVSTYLALTFGTLLSSQGTGRFPSVFLTLPDPFPVRFRSEFRFRPPAGAGSFAPSGVITTLADSP